MKENKLTSKDLITTGIYTALYIACIFVVGMFNAIPIFYPIFMFVGPLIIGIPMILYFLKIEKFGMLTITGVIMGVFFYISGYTWISLACIIPAALLADIVLKIGGYKKFKSITLSYMCISLGIIAGPANLIFAGESYWDNIRKSMGDQYADQLAKYMPDWMFPVGLILLAIGAFFGALLGRQMMNKHFKKAGIV
jgi:energy-coupling factor transport system substrate-specific component